MHYHCLKLRQIVTSGGLGRMGLLLGLLVLSAVVLASCNNSAEAPSTPNAAAVLARPQKLPTRPARTTTPTIEQSRTEAPGAEPIDATATPAVSEGSAIARDVPSSGRLPGAYVRSVSAIMSETPGGRTLARIPAGSRLGILEQDSSGAWLRVQYQPDPEAEAQTGWVRVSNLSIFADLDDLLDSEEPVAEIEGESDAIAQGSAIILANRLNVRGGPGTNQRIIGTLNQGDQVQLLGRTGNNQWLQVQIDGGEIGWTAARWLEPAVAVPSLPVTGSAATGVPNPTSSSSSEIVFQARNGGDIYMINANGSGLRRLTYGFDPALSPDGGQVAFTRHDVPPGLWIINVDGSGERRLFEANRPRSPTWSPDGQTIFIEHNYDNRACRVTPIGCYTEERIREEWGGNECFTYPNNMGTYCITDFRLSSAAFNGILSYDLASGSVRDIPTSTTANAPHHHPNSQDILYFNRDGLAITKGVGDESPVQLIQADNLSPGVYSPDGQFIYTSRRSGDHWDIWRYRADGSSPQALTAPPGIRDAAIHSVSPTLSPDGRSILFLTNRRGGVWEFWIMDSDGGNPRPFASQALANIDFNYGFARERMADWGS